MHKKTSTAGKHLKKPEDLMHISVSDKQLGAGYKGKVFFGRIKLKGERGTKRVAVKYFDHWLSDKEAQVYQQTIDNLHSAGVPLPKMGMVKINGRWAQVSELFGTIKKGSRFPEQRPPRENLNYAKGRKAYAQAFIGTIKAGYLPPIDYIRCFGKDSFIPIDIDELVGPGLKEPEPELLKQALTLNYQTFEYLKKPALHALIKEMKNQTTNKKSISVLSNLQKELLQEKH